MPAALGAAEAALRSRAVSVTVWASVKGVVTPSRTSSLRACLSGTKNTCTENSTAANQREISADLPGHQLLISMTSGVLGDGGYFDAEPGALVITMTWCLRASSSTISIM